MKKYFILIVLPSLLISCGQSDIERLSHKWVVSSANYYTNLPLTTEERKIEWNITDSIYSSREYDIHEDGTFDLVNKDVKVSGTWKNEYGYVTFWVNEKVYDKWIYPSEKIEIFHDSSMTLKTDWCNDMNYIGLTLKPAPGQKVITDY